MNPRFWLVIAAALMAASGPAHATTLAALEAQLTHTEAQLQQVQRQLQQWAAQRGAAQQQANQATRWLVQAARTPPLLQQWQLVHQPLPVGPAILSFMATQQQQQLGQLAAQHQGLFTLYRQAQQSQQELLAVAEAIRQTETRRQRQQRALLAETGRDATRLARQLSGALAVSSSQPRVVRAALPQPLRATSSAVGRAVPAGVRRHPAGGSRVVLRFRQGEGAEREGVVLALPTGQAVTSPLAGTVLFAEGFRQFGGVVIIKGTDGHQELLGGLAVLQVSPGQTVRAGQPLGTVGPRGRVYWEVRVRGRPRDPLAGLGPIKPARESAMSPSTGHAPRIAQQ